MADVIYCKVPPTEKRPSGLKIIVPGKLGVEAAMKDIPADTIKYIIADSSICPQDRYFRNAWELGEDDKPKVNFGKAKKIHINKLRKERDKKLETLDAKFMQALENGDVAKQDEIKQKKQKLRDMPTDPVFDSANTPEQLKSIIPDYMRL